MKGLPIRAIGLLTMLTGSAAMAADLPAIVHKAPPAPAVVAQSWTGFYLGVNAGASIGRNRTTDTTVLAPTGPGLTFPVFGADSVSRAPFGAIAGGQVGFNWQAAPSWLLGVELDAQWSDQTDSACISACLPPSTIPGLLLSLTDEQKLTWFGTARGRVGWIAPNGTLWYATGGAAFGRVEQTLTLAGTTGFFAAGTTSAASFSHNRVGWTVGGGVEAPLAGNWSAKAEYLYVDLGGVTDSFSSPLALAAQPPATTQTTTSSYTIHDHIVRLGLNYRFGAPFPGDTPSAPMFYKAAPQVAARSWTGFYLGVNGGASLGRNQTTDTTTTQPPVTVLGNDSFNNAPIGGIFGGQVGFNWQASPSWLLGVEADAQWSGQSVSACVSACLPAAPGGSLLSVTDEQKLTWFGTARGRIGWVTSNGTLWYATGGAAWGGVEQTLTLASTAGFLAGGATSAAASFSHDRIGWTVGGGVEAPLAGNWSAKAEYLYVDLGSVSDSFTSALGAGLVPATTQTMTSSYTIHDHIVRVGVNYRFGQ